MFTHYILTAILLVETSAANGQPVTTGKPDVAEDRQPAPSLGAPVLEQALDGVSKLGLLSGRPEKLEAGGNPAVDKVPMVYVWARISKDYLATFVERQVNREKPASDRILGITFVGTSRTNGQTKLVLEPSQRGALAKVVFQGKIESQTTGHEGPATLYYVSNSTFRASKSIVVDDRGLRVLPAQAEAPTRLTPVEIRTSLPRLRGRIAQRIAWRRVAKSRAEADAIASQHRAADIREGLDRRLDDEVATLQAKVQTQLADLHFGTNEAPVAVWSRSTPQFIEIALLPAGIHMDRFRAPEFQVPDNAQLAVRVHPTVLARVIADSSLRARYEKLTAGILSLPMTDANKKDVGNDLRPQLAMDAGWFGFNLQKSATRITDVSVAAESTDHQFR
jgi:hypothetical protein